MSGLVDKLEDMCETAERSGSHVANVSIGANMVRDIIAALRAAEWRNLTEDEMVAKVRLAERRFDATGTGPDIGAYVTAMANWSIALDERDAALRERDGLREQFHSDGAIATECWELLRDDVVDPDRETLAVVVRRLVAERDDLRAALIECRVAINEACYRGRDRVRLLEADERASRVLDERKPENLEEQNNE